MIAAPDLNEIKQRVQSLDDPWRLVSLLFAKPDSVAMMQLEQNMYELDVAAGDHWDLFFPGYFRYVPEDMLPTGRQVLPVEANRPPWIYSAAKSNELVEWVRATSGENWLPSGRGDLVSFIAYQPWTVDAMTIVPDVLTKRSNLMEIADGLVRWSADDVDADLAPGQVGGVKLDMRLSAIAALTSVAPAVLEMLCELALPSG